MISPELVTVIPTRAVLLDHDDTGIITRRSEYVNMIEVGERLGRVGELAVTHAILDESWGLPFEEQFAAVYGTGQVQAAINIYNEIATAKPREVNAGYRELLDQFDMHCMPFGIVSHHNRDMIRQELAALDIEPGRHVLIHGSEDLEGYHKPSGRALLPALRWLENRRIFPDEVTYIGDDERDMRAAAEAGTNFIGVTTGIHTTQEFDSIAEQYGLPQPHLVPSLEHITVRSGKLVIPSRAALAA